jgi:D-galactarolactone isomerase
VKLSGPYLEGGDAQAVAAELARLAPERCVWGSDWPHPTESSKPDDLALRRMLDAWVPDPAARERILVDNPAALYGF